MVRITYFPDKCGDGYAYAGTDFDKLRRTMEGYGLLWPRSYLDANLVSSDGQIFDVVEFAYEHIAEAKDPSYHSYMSHSHYSYDQEAGRAKFKQDVNRIFERNGIAFELKHGEVIRVTPTGLEEALPKPYFTPATTLSMKCSKPLGKSSLTGPWTFDARR